MSTVEPFANFLARTTAARPDQYSAAIRAAAAKHGLTEAEVSAEFNRMKAYILNYYQGVTPVHSARDASQQIVDYVPFDQQPALRAAVAAGQPTGLTPPAPAPLSDAPLDRGTPTGGGPRSGLAELPGMDAGDASPAPAPAPGPGPVSSAPGAPAGTVPLVRVTLEQLLSLGTLDNFFRKR